MFVTNKTKPERMSTKKGKYEDDVARGKDVMAQVHLALHRCTLSSGNEVRYNTMLHSNSGKWQKILKISKSRKSKFE